MVAFGLAGIHLCKRGNGTIERIPIPQVAADQCRVSGARALAPGLSRITRRTR